MTGYHKCLSNRRHSYIWFVVSTCYHLPPHKVKRVWHFYTVCDGGRKTNPSGWVQTRPAGFGPIYPSSKIGRPANKIQEFYLSNFFSNSKIKCQCVRKEGLLKHYCRETWQKISDKTLLPQTRDFCNIESDICLWIFSETCLKHVVCFIFSTV